MYLKSRVTSIISSIKLEYVDPTAIKNHSLVSCKKDLIKLNLRFNLKQEEIFVIIVTIDLSR